MVPRDDGKACAVFNPVSWWRVGELWTDPPLRVVDYGYHLAIGCFQGTEIRGHESFIWALRSAVTPIYSNAVSGQHSRVYPILEAEITVKDLSIPEHWPRAYALDIRWNTGAAIWGAPPENRRGSGEIPKNKMVPDLSCFGATATRLSCYLSVLQSHLLCKNREIPTVIRFAPNRARSHSSLAEFPAISHEKWLLTSLVLTQAGAWRKTC